MEKLDRKLASMLSLCQRAGCIASGEEGTELALKNKKAKLVIIADDASENTKKKFLNKTSFYKVNAVVCGSKNALGTCIGKSDRTVLAVINNDSFADKIFELVQNLLL